MFSPPILLTELPQELKKKTGISIGLCTIYELVLNGIIPAFKNTHSGKWYMPYDGWKQLHSHFRIKLIVK